MGIISIDNLVWGKKIDETILFYKCRITVEKETKNERKKIILEWKDDSRRKWHKIFLYSIIIDGEKKKFYSTTVSIISVVRTAFFPSNFCVASRVQALFIFRIFFVRNCILCMEKPSKSQCNIIFGKCYRCNWTALGMGSNLRINFSSLFEADLIHSHNCHDVEKKWEE